MLLQPGLHIDVAWLGVPKARTGDGSQERDTSCFVEHSLRLQLMISARWTCFLF